jgi:two-component system, NtrC family, phosphoglycerate transport system sensor histidine kinase PgtB
MKLPSYGLSSIGGRVNLLFAAISTIMAGAMLLSWMAFEELGAQINEINEVRVPSLSRTINLFGAADDFLNIGPKLTRASTNERRLFLYGQMTDHMGKLNKIKETHEAADTETKERIEGLIENLSTSLTHLNSSAKYRLRLNGLKEDQAEILKIQYSDFKETISQHLGVSGLDKAFLDLDRKGRDFYDGLLYLEEIKTKVDLEIAEKNLEALTLDLLGGAAVFSIEMLESTQNLTNSLTLREGLLRLHHAKLTTIEDTTRELENARVRIVQLRLILSLNVKNTQEAVEQSSRDARQLIRSRTAQMALSMAVVVVLSFAASFVFVRRSLVRRLTQLEDRMNRIAKGELDTTIDTRGKDEISRMARALEIFRQTAREVEEQQTRAIIESSVAGLVMTNGKGDIEFLSHTARTLFGYDLVPPNDSKKMRVEQLVARNEGQLLSDMLENCRSYLNSDQSTSPAMTISEFNAQKRDGTTFPSDIAVRGIKQRSGQKFIFTIYDVTERKQAQQTLEQTVSKRTFELSKTNRELEQEIKTRIETEKALRSTKEELVQASKLAALGKMASGISHEFNQPLTAVASWLHNVNLLLKNGDLNEADKALSNIDTQINRMIELASHLQTLARQPDLSFAPVNLRQILDRSLSLFQVRMHQEGTNVQTIGLEQDTKLVTDALRLEQVFINLFANALDVMTAQSVKELGVIVDTSMEGRINITVTDNGPGVPVEIIEHLFDPFFTTKEVGKGMGLGLSISYNIVRSLGGNLTVRNQENAGASFRITLPAHTVTSTLPVRAEEIW